MVPDEWMTRHQNLKERSTIIQNTDRKASKVCIKYDGAIFFHTTKCFYPDTKVKEIAKLQLLLHSGSRSDEDSDPEQARRIRIFKKNLCNSFLRYFKKLYKPTNNNLRTSSNSRNKTEDTTPRYNNDNQSGQFGNQRQMTVAGAKRNMGSRYVPLQANKLIARRHGLKRIIELELESTITLHGKDSGGIHRKSSSSWVTTGTGTKTDDENDVFANVRRHSEQPESINDTYVLEKDDSNVIPDSSNIIPNTELTGKYTALNVMTLTSDYKILQTKLNETLGLLARKDIDIKEGLKTKTYEISVVNQKHDELVKKSLLTRSQFEGQLKEKTKVISDLKVKEGKDIDTMIEMDKQIKFLNEILYKRNQSIQTIHMLAPKCATYHGRSTFANPKYLKKAQSDKPRLYEIPYDTSDPANRFCPDGEETVTLEKESRSKLDKDTVKPYNYTYQNSLYETFKPPSKAYLDQLERAKEVRKTMWRKTFVRTKPNIAKNVGFLPMSKSISKIKECECLAQKLSKQTESVNKEVHNNLLKSFAKLEKHSISLELSLQHCKEQMKNNPVCKENASNVFRKEREQYHEIQDLKAQMQDKNMVINELKKLILVTKGKSMETQFDKPYVVRQPNAQRIPKPTVLGKPTPFSNSPEMRSFQPNKSVNKTNASDGLFKPVTQQSFPGMFRIASTTTQTRTP
ncbi:hypothetical protein Tco_0150765 [Tanacetum coccineum]